MPRFLTGLLLALVLGGCGETIVLIDPPVTYASVDAGGGTMMGPSLALGLFSEQFFTVLENGAALPIRQPFQGGRKVEPAVRTTGLTNPVQATASVTLKETGERVGFVEGEELLLQPTAEGFSENVGLPIDIERAEGIEALFDKEASLSMDVVDFEMRSASAMVDVVLIEG